MTKKNFSVSKGKKLRRVCYVAIAVMVLGFATWLMLSMLTMKTAYYVVATYNPPEFASLYDIYSLGTGAYAVTVDGEVVAGEAQNEVRPTASMAKMILGLAVMQVRPLELGESGENIVIDDKYYQLYKDYYANGGSVSAVEVGEEISEYDALMSIFLVSSNNMADALAMWAFGSLENYQIYATDMLNKWGIHNTTIGIDASGFDASTTSTASDMAKIGTLVMRQPVLREIVGTTTYTVPVEGEMENTNKLLGLSNISGVKTGYIGEESGYCLTSAYMEGDSVVVVALMGALTREESFAHNIGIVNVVQDRLTPTKLVSAGEAVGYYDSWWTGKITITADEDIYGLSWAGVEPVTTLDMNGQTGTLALTIGGQTYSGKVSAASYVESPSLMDKLRHAFGWKSDVDETAVHGAELPAEDEGIAEGNTDDTTIELVPITSAESENCTIDMGNLMLIDPNFPVEESFIATRRTELVSISSLYNIVEGNPGNGDNLLDPEAATHINDMVKAYEAEYPGHTLETRSCFRAVGTGCGRLCAATGESDHHTGLTCDLLDPAYGTELDTDYYEEHIDWQWLKANSYKYGFVDRFPEAWAGGSMSEPLNVDESGSTGLYETWHYRYVGIPVATEIATGKYNNGEYDSLEHYLKARGLVIDLKGGKCK